MTALFSFTGQIRPLPYFVWSMAVFFSQHLLVWVIDRAYGVPLVPDGWFWVVPLGTLARLPESNAVLLYAAFAYGALVAWVLAVLAFRRAANADASEWLATVAVIPLFQIGAIVMLSLMPPDRQAPDAPAKTLAHSPAAGWGALAQALIGGVAVTVFAVAVGTLVFGTYAYGVFLLSPFLLGAVTGYFANRAVDRGGATTTKLITLAGVLGAIALIGLALEGAVCILLAAPLAIGFAIVGGMLGRAIARRGDRPVRQAFSGFVLLPMVFAMESVVGSTTRFDTVQTIEIGAPPQVVWQALLRMDTIDTPRALPFRLGVAYPVRGEVVGEGVGALRRGEFSTGTAIERVTEWVPERKLAFEVVEDVPSIRELSPYDHVHAPHAVGYFTTSLTSFELMPLAGSRTRVVERTAHQLRLEPILYWLPMARFIVDQNNARVLAHIKRQSERAAASR